MKKLTNTIITENDLLNAGAELLDTHGNNKIYEIYPISYIVKEEQVIHTYDSLPKRGETK